MVKMKQFVIYEKSFDKARESIRKNSDKEIIFCGGLDDDLNRKILEKEKVNILLINLMDRKDFMKQRNSGFNQVLAKIAKKHGVIIGINFDEIIESKGREKAQVLARIRQNIMLCNKNKLGMRFISLKNNNRDVYDLKALGLVLGMPTNIVKFL